MPSLEAVQRALATAIVERRPAAAAAHVIDDAPGAAARLAIYANHFRITLTDALAATYPVIKRLVGADFFAFAAGRFIARQPPREPRVFAYGDGFADFLAALPEAAQLVYLADVARLEWALNAAYFAADAPSLDAATLSNLPASVAVELSVALHPACALIRSPFPIDRIWRLNQDDAWAGATIDLNEGGASLLVHRDGDDVGWLTLDAGAFAFARTLADGRSLRAAAEAALTADPRFDPTALLATLIEAGALLAPAPLGAGTTP